MADSYYSFISFLRQGIANSVAGVDDSSKTNAALSPARGRASVDVTVSLNMDGAVSKLPVKNLQLYGPGDITGIDKRAIIRTEPQNYSTNFEPNYLAFIEFYEEDLPWRFTPTAVNAVIANNKKLTPWLTLVVIEESELSSTNFTIKENAGQSVINNTKPLPYFKLKNVATDKAKIFPASGDLWAWAHVHVNGDIPKADTVNGTVDSASMKANLNAVLDQDGDYCYSRIICPRRLAPNKAYYAFLIPSFETGRLAGLGQFDKIKDVPVNKSAWAADNDEHPFYHHWYFRTGNMGDFEYLVKQLKPKPADIRVGYREIFAEGIMKPDNKAEKALYMPGALRVPMDTLPQDKKNTVGNYENWEGNTNPHPWQENVSVQLNIQLDADKEPVISLPVYGRWHGLTEDILYTDGDKTHPLSDAIRRNWVHELNLDPRYRAAAAMGTKVIQNNQEELMAAAWNQIDEINEANKKVREMQVVIEVNKAINRNIVARFNEEQVISFTNAIHKVVKETKTSATTLYSGMLKSPVPDAVTTNVFKKMTRNTWRINSVANYTKQVFSGNVMKQLNESAMLLGPLKTTPMVVTQKYFNDNIVGAYVTGLPEYKKLSTADKSKSIKQVTDVFAYNADLISKIKADDPKFVYRATNEALKVKAASPVTASKTSSTAFKSGLTNSKLVFDLSKGVVVQSGTPISLSDSVAAIKADIKAFPAIKLQFQGLFPGVSGEIVSVADEQVYPVIVYPKFDLPMYLPLTETSSENFLPNINLLEQNSVTLLETNQRFIEAYMAGLNHEMSRELLWRGFPTDQRGSYFRVFWDSLTDRVDINEMHKWTKTLGNNSATSNAGLLVLVIRGDLLSKYPNTVIYAQEAEWDVSVTNDRKLKTGSAPVYPLFEAKVDPDIYLLGFQLNETDLIGDLDPQNVSAKAGWYFVMHERPGEPRFGFDIKRTTDKIDQWSDMAWSDTGTAEGNVVKFSTLTANVSSAADRQAAWPPKDAAQNAYIMYQQPALIAIHASKLLK